jgi:hypothetical protein
VPGEKFNAEEIRKRSRFSKLASEYRRAVFAGKTPAETDALIAPAKDLAPADFNLENFKRVIQLQYAFREYLTEATGQANEAKLDALAAKLDISQMKEALLLNEMAWTILTEGRLKKRDLALATKFAKAAYDACGGKEPGIVDTYARALGDSGRLGEAITCLNQAIGLTEDQNVKAQLTESLKKYEARRQGAGQ